MNIKFRVCLWKIHIKKKYYLLEPIILKYRKRKNMTMKSMLNVLSSAKDGQSLSERKEVMKQTVHRPMQKTVSNIAEIDVQLKNVMQVGALPILHKNPGEINTVV